MDEKLTQRLVETVEKLATAVRSIPRRKGDWINEPSMSLEEAAEFLGVHPNRMREFNRQGLAHYKGLAKSITYLRSDLIKWREKYRVQQADKVVAKLVEKVLPVLPLTTRKAS